MNAAAYEAMSEIAEVNYVGPVHPRVDWSSKVFSKVLRVSGGKGSFSFFSENRLKRIAHEVHSASPREAEFDFFHGFTPWVRCQTKRPYLAWSDCCFRDYIDIFHNPQAFSSSDIERICNAEAQWLANAQGVFLSSEWANTRVHHHYGISQSRLRSVGIFGAMDYIHKDAYKDGKDFLFVSTDYQRKNGRLCREAMDIVWETFPDARLKIIGDAPPSRDLVANRVLYEGYLDKSNPQELRRLRDLFSTAFALVHPTDADIAPLILVEAALFGCPAITVDDFAVPEVTGAGTSALLLKRPLTPKLLASAMLGLLGDRDRYLDMRKQCRGYSVENHSRKKFKKRLQEAVLDAAKACQG